MITTVNKLIININAELCNPNKCSSGVGVKSEVCRPERLEGRRVVMDVGLRIGVRNPPKKLGFWLVLGGEGTERRGYGMRGDGGWEGKGNGKGTIVKVQGRGRRSGGWWA